MIVELKPPSSSLWLLLQLPCFFFIVLFSCNKTNAQNATTDPSEVRALNSIFQQWGTQAADSWNISGEPCSGLALSPSDSDFNDGLNNPAIRCDCTFNNNTVCHIIRLRAFSLDRQGVIPKELLDLPYLMFLKIDRNFFSGLLPAFIGNMSRLELLSLAHNVFSGPIPKELGNLKQLLVLSLSNNNFSGTLPPELGNLVNLEQIYINSCGLGGKIPETFSNLTKLQTVRAVDISFTGKIPEFIGNKWTMLTELRFVGNSFEGPIPSNFANLISLQLLRISGIYNGRSSLDFVRNLKSLSDLVLRNCLLTGVLPSYITELQSLQKLDLSFNNLSGQIPSALFNMNSLENLFLGNNSLSGTIPSQKSETLKTIDLSYNFLSGDLPSWTNSGIQLNLVANNFTSNSSNIRLLQGLECLQRSFPCNRNPPRYANFSIKCGGPEMRSDGILFEAENTTLGPATYYVTSTKKWAVSNAGMFAERQNQQFVENSFAVVRSTGTPSLYQTSRLSPGSLRYYGLCLENGIYTVYLFFAETGFPPRSTQTWRSLGRRVFNVYIQGTLQLRDFDISKAAGDVQIAITRNFTANVTENHLEIHLFWAGKGTCCTPEDGYYGPSISAINVVPNFKPTVSGVPPGNPKDKNINTALIVGIATALPIVALIVIFAIIYVRRRKEEGRKQRSKEKLQINMSKVVAKFSSHNEVGELQQLPLFNFEELATATNNFHLTKMLGHGGFGPVYRGTLQDGKEIAVKRLSSASGQGLEEFMNEVVVISKLQHRNLVKLFGCCVDGEEKMLVYEHMPNKSLDSFLFDPVKREVLDWKKRFNIIEGISRGLLYLHRDSRLRIIHRDLKASNVLLDEELNPKISDFGMARIFGVNENQANTKRVVGTYGYMSPEYAMQGRFSEKSDVFSFGVLLLEIVSGRRNTSFYNNQHCFSLLGYAWNLWKEGNVLGLVDRMILVSNYAEKDIMRCIHVGLLCVQEMARDRPTMSSVVSMLNSEIVDLPTPKQLAFIGTQFTQDGEDRVSLNYLTVTAAFDGR